MLVGFEKINIIDSAFKRVERDSNARIPGWSRERW